MLNSSSLSSLSIDMETAFSSSRSSPLNWDDCEDNATCDDVSLLEDDDDDDEFQSLQVCCCCCCCLHSKIKKKKI